MTTSNNKERSLIKRVKEGDIEAFRQIVDKYKDISLSLACSILKDENLAEDSLQDSFIKVYKNIKAFRLEASFSTWLYRIVVNTSYNLLKKNRSQVDFVEVNSVLSETAEHRADNTLNHKDQKRFINLALNNLKPDEALLLRLFYLCEFKISEIKQITGFRKSKIKVDLHRGRKNLNNELRKILGPEIYHLL